MKAWDQIRTLLLREKRDVDEALEDFKAKANASLDQRERDLHATPEEKLLMEQERAAENDAAFDDVRRRIEGDTPAT